MKAYPESKSQHARHATWTVQFRCGSEFAGSTLLSLTQPRRALRRLIAHLRKEFPAAVHYGAGFPSYDIYEGESA